jgi:hypothetical protein
VEWASALIEVYAAVSAEEMEKVGHNFYTEKCVSL